MLLGERVFSPSVDHVTMQDIDAARAATEHLLADRQAWRLSTHDPETGRSAVFLVNRAIEGPTTVTVDGAGLGGVLTVELPAVSWTAISLG